MKIIQLSFLYFLSLSAGAFGQTQTEPAQIAWDTYGVPHITAATVEDLFYAQGWAQMHNHANLITELYGTSRGKGAEYWGKDKLRNDVLVQTLDFDSLADDWESKQDPEVKKMFSAFVSGMNDYATAHPEAIEEKNRVVLPLTTKDVNMHSMYVVFLRFIGGRDLGLVQQWTGLGSNAYAIGPERSASGNAMLVQNPHLPWFNEFLFFESQLNFNGKRMYGTTLVGLPGIAIGFNENLGWSHTNNIIDNADTFELELKDDGYLMDGERKEFISSSKKLKVSLEDGTFISMEIPVLNTVHGPVVKTTENKVLALRMVGLDRPNMLLQWWRMINSCNFAEFESALQLAQIPFWNVIYADKEGEIFFLSNGLVPVRSSGDWAYWDGVIPGGKSADVWTEVHPYADLPKLKNPKTGWLQNSNDPPWTSTIPASLDPADFPPYMAPQFMDFRSQRAARMILEDESITFDELVEYKHSTRMEFADRILDDLFAAIDASDSEKAKEAKVVLENWDRRADTDSKGTALFYSWANMFAIGKDANYTKRWDMKNPNTTPDGIADPARAVELLELAATEVQTQHGQLDLPWGEFYRINYNGKNLPANGAEGSMGVFRVAWPGGGDKEHLYVGGGDSWVGVIEFGDEVKAKVLLSYGNATQKDSPHNGDQLEHFSKKELRDAWFTEAEVEANTKSKETLQRKEIVEKQQK